MDEADGTDDSALAEQPVDPGAVEPSSEVKAELQGYLEADPSRVGEVYRLEQEGSQARR